MKREARQHGMVRTHRVLPSPWNPKPKTQNFRRLDALSVAGLFSSIHSKFTGKCGRPQCLECRLNPVRKSKDKTKGTQKFRTSDMVVTPRLITGRVVDRRPGFNFSGFSAAGILDYLYGVNEEDEIDDHVNDHDDDYENGGTCALDDDNKDDDDFMANFWSLHDKDVEKYDDDDDAMSFCDVGFMLDQTEEDEDWCLLGEL